VVDNVYGRVYEVKISGERRSKKFQHVACTGHMLYGFNSQLIECSNA